MPTLLPTKASHLFVVKTEPQDRPSKAEIEKSHIHWLRFNGYFAHAVDEKAMNRRNIRVNVRFVDRFESTLFEMDHSNHLVVVPVHEGYSSGLFF